MIEVHCSRCGNVSRHKTLWKFVELGWRNVGTADYCPKCVKDGVKIYHKDQKVGTLLHLSDMLCREYAQSQKAEEILMDVVLDLKYRDEIQSDTMRKLRK